MFIVRIEDPDQPDDPAWVQVVNDPRTAIALYVDQFSDQPVYNVGSWNLEDQVERLVRIMGRDLVLRWEDE